MHKRKYKFLRGNLSACVEGCSKEISKKECIVECKLEGHTRGGEALQNKRKNINIEMKRQNLKMKGHQDHIWKVKVNSFLKINKYIMNEARRRLDKKIEAARTRRRENSRVI
jgi:hypothetical protein